MEKIMLPTDLFIRMLDWELDCETQLLYLALIINRQVNLTGVYVITRREMRYQLPLQFHEGRKLQTSLEKLKSKHLVYYDDNVIFIPLVPETSKFARHSFRHRMQRYVDKLQIEKPSNSAIRAFNNWCAANNVAATIGPSQDPTDRRGNTAILPTSDKNDHYVVPMTTAEKYAQMSNEERFRSISKTRNVGIPTDKKHMGPGQALSSSSSLSSSYHSRRSTGIDVKGGAGEKIAQARTGLDELSCSELPLSHRDIDENENGDSEEAGYG